MSPWHHLSVGLVIVAAVLLVSGLVLVLLPGMGWPTVFGSAMAVVGAVGGTLVLFQLRVPHN